MRYAALRQRYIRVLNWLRVATGLRAHAQCCSATSGYCEATSGYYAVTSGYCVESACAVVNTRSAHAQHPGLQTHHPGASPDACAVHCRSYCACATSGHSVIHSAAALLSVRSIRALPHLHPGTEDAMKRYDPHCACAVFGYSSKPPPFSPSKPDLFPFLGFNALSALRMRHIRAPQAALPGSFNPPSPPPNIPHAKIPFRTSSVP